MGAIGRRTDNVTVGGAWVLPGSYLTTLTLEVRSRRKIVRLTNFRPMGQPLVEGRTINSNFGRAVAVIDGRLAVGAIFDEIGGIPTVGSVSIYSVNAQGVSDERNTADRGNLASGRSGRGVHQRRSLERGVGFLVGGFDGNGSGLDNGSAYPLPLPVRP